MDQISHSSQSNQQNQINLRKASFQQRSIIDLLVVFSSDEIDWTCKRKIVKWAVFPIDAWLFVCDVKRDGKGQYFDVGWEEKCCVKYLYLQKLPIRCQL